MSDLSAPELVLQAADPADAAEITEVIHAAFGARPPLDPPSTAIDETPDTVAAKIIEGGGVVARMGGTIAGVILLARDGATAQLNRVSVHPAFQRHGIASAMVEAIDAHAAELGCTRVELVARVEFPELVEFWRHRGFEAVGGEGCFVRLARDLPVVVAVPTAEEMRRLGVRLAALLRPGDVVIASGELGAGKTTLTQGLAEGLDVVGPVISPTFVLSRVHPSRGTGPALVHVDAYRLGSAEELDDLGLDLDDAVAVIEWGEGLADHLAEDRLEIGIEREPVMATQQTDAVTDDDPRIVIISGIGSRWRRDELAAAVSRS